MTDETPVIPCQLCTNPTKSCVSMEVRLVEHTCAALGMNYLYRVPQWNGMQANIQAVRRKDVMAGIRMVGDDGCVDGDMEKVIDDYLRGGE